MNSRGEGDDGGDVSVRHTSGVRTYAVREEVAPAEVHGPYARLAGSPLHVGVGMGPTVILASALAAGPEAIASKVRIEECTFWDFEAVDDQDNVVHLAGCTDRKGDGHDAETKALREAIEEIKDIRDAGGRVTGDIFLNDDGTIQRIAFEHDSKAKK